MTLLWTRAPERINIDTTSIHSSLQQAVLVQYISKFTLWTRYKLENNKYSHKFQPWAVILSLYSLWELSCVYAYRSLANEVYRWVEMVLNSSWMIKLFIGKSPDQSHVYCTYKVENTSRMFVGKSRRSCRNKRGWVIDEQLWYYLSSLAWQAC